MRSFSSSKKIERDVAFENEQKKHTSIPRNLIWITVRAPCTKRDFYFGFTYLVKISTTNGPCLWKFTHIGGWFI